ncbi:MAG: hypothetical protein ABIP48_22520 [Planctomycetota bacterium]
MLADKVTLVVAACAASGLLTFLILRVAPRIRLTDHPDGHHKIHGHPTPLGGGLAVYLAMASVLVAALNPMAGYINAFRASLYGGPFYPEFLLFSVAFTLLVLTGGAFFFARLQGRFADVI